MTDFDERLAAVLSGQALEAPVVAGLAGAARRRLVARRRRRAALCAAAVLVVVAPAAMIALDDGDSDRAASDPTPVGWRTIEHHGIRVEIPAGWGLNTCRDGATSDVVQYSAADGSCDSTGFLSIYPAEEDEREGVVQRLNWDEGRGPLWGGYVETGGWGVGMWDTDRGLVRRVLASMRSEDSPLVVAEAWRETVTDGVSYSAPVGWGVGAGDGDGFQVEVDEAVSRQKRLQSSVEIDASHYRLVGQLADRIVTITAPTQAVAQLVWASVDAGKSPDLVAGLPCNPGLGDPQSGETCPNGYSKGDLSLGADGDLTYDPVGGSPYVLDLNAASVCSGVILVDYREPLADHVVGCGEFRRALEDGTPRIPVVVWDDDAGDVAQMSELYVH